MKRFTKIALIFTLSLSSLAFAEDTKGNPGYADTRDNAAKDYETAKAQLQTFNEQYKNGIDYSQYKEIYGTLTDKKNKSTIDKITDKIKKLEEEIAPHKSYLDSNPMITIVEGKNQSQLPIFTKDANGKKIINPKLAGKKVISGQKSILSSARDHLSSYNSINSKIKSKQGQVTSKVVSLRRGELEEAASGYAKDYHDNNQQFEDELSRLTADLESKYKAVCYLHKKCKKYKNEAACKMKKVGSIPKENWESFSEKEYPLAGEESKFLFSDDSYKEVIIKELVVADPIPAGQSEVVSIDGEDDTKVDSKASMVSDPHGFQKADLFEIQQAEGTNKICDVWALKQTNKNDAVVSERERVIEEDDQINGDFGTDGVDPNNSPAMNSHIAKNFEEANIDFKFKVCEDLFNEERKVPGNYCSYKCLNGKNPGGRAADILKIEPVASKAFASAKARRAKRPSQCTGEKNPFFKDMEELQLFTNSKINPLEKLRQSAKEKICVGIAYRQDDQGNTCNDYLELMLSCNEKGGLVKDSSKLSVFTSINDKDFALAPGDPERLASFANNTVGFASEKNCKDFLNSKFRQCMGLDYEGYKRTLDDTGNISFEKVDKDEAVYKEMNERAKERLVAETSNQIGVCLAFRELSMEQAIELDLGSWEAGEQVASIDGRFACTRVKPWTQDYKACRSLVDAYNVFLAGNTARQVGGQVWSGINQRNIQENSTNAMTTASNNALEAQKNGEESNLQGDQVNIALDAQRKAYEHQKDKEFMNAGFFTAQTGTLTAMLASFPTPNKFGGKCDDGESERGSYCIAAGIASMDSAIKRQLFPNQNVKKMMWGKVMESASSAALAALKAAQFNSMAKNVGKYKDAFNGLNKEATQTESDFQVGYCALNPTAPGCTANGPRVQGNSQFSYGNVGNQANGGGQYGFDNNSDMGDFEEGDQLSPSQQSAINDLGNIMDQDSAGSFGSGIESKVGQGSFKRNHLGSGGSGSSSGGAASGSAYKGGDGGTSSRGNTAFDGSKQKVSYGAGSGKVKYGSGSGSRSKKSSNPFSSLFGKKRGRKVASQVNNDIAPSHSGLFEKISKRYTKMQQDNRLYKLK